MIERLQKLEGRLTLDIPIVALPGVQRSDPHLGHLMTTVAIMPRVLGFTPLLSSEILSYICVFTSEKISLS